MRMVSTKDQLFLVLCRLRQGCTVKDLAYRFSISVQAVSDIFTGWITYVKRQFGFLSWWPHRDRIVKNMPVTYKENFPTSLAITDSTELRTQTPSSLKAQSQCFSDYKSCTTLKSLVVVDPLGSVMYVSKWFTGSMSDNEICEKSGFYQFLRKLLQTGHIECGDAIMADKGFRIGNELRELGLELNIPPFASSGQQMASKDVELTNLIAAHRIHVERRISKIINFKIFAADIPISMFPVINDIWYVCCHLTNFQDLIVRK